MTMARARAKPGLTIAGGDLAWLMDLLRVMQDTYAVTVVHTPRASGMRADVQTGVAIVELDNRTSAPDVRDLLDASPGVRFLFIADVLPLRHALARIVRARGHAVLARNEPLVVVAATLTALLAEGEALP
jgi:hypothetical protein